MPAFHILNRIYGRGAHRAFKQCLDGFYPDHRRAFVQAFDALPSLQVIWGNGAHVTFRLHESTIHVQELANSSSGDEPEGLYRWLARESGLPELFKSWGVKTLTCEPSDEDARARLGRYPFWEVWTTPDYHPVWVWWLGTRTVAGIEDAIDFALDIQEERRGEVRPST